MYNPYYQPQYHTYPVSYNPFDGLPDSFVYQGSGYTRRSNPFSRAFNQGHLVVPASSNNPPVHRPPTPSNAQAHSQPQPDGPSSNITSTSAPNGVPVVNTNSSEQPQPFQTPSADYNQNNQAMALRSVIKQPIYYSAPHPSMWPLPVPQNQIPNFQSLGSGLHPMPMFHPSPTPIPFTAHNLAHHPANFGPQPISNPDRTKYKCQSCGRIRSPRYHHEHPLLPGQLPGRTTCRRCQKKTTVSNADSTDSYEEARLTRRHVDRRKSSRSRSEPPTSHFRQIANHRRSVNEPEQREMSSSSDDYSDRHGLRDGRTSVRPVEIIRYVEVPTSHRRSQRNGIEGTNFDRYHDRDHQEAFYPAGFLKRTHNGSREPSPDPHLDDWHDNRGQTPYYQHDCDYVDGPGALDMQPLRNRRTGFRTSAVSRGSQAMLMSSDERTPYYTHRGNTEYDGSGDERSRHRTSSVRARSSKRNNSRQRDDADDAQRSSIPRAPSPPTIPRQSHPDMYSAMDQPGRNPRGQQRYTVQMSNRYGLRPDEEVTVFENDQAHSVEDYDWYDQNGMRVRIREI